MEWTVKALRRDLASICRGKAEKPQVLSLTFHVMWGNGVEMARLILATTCSP